MVDVRQVVRLAGLAVSRPVEFTDRLAGRRERAHQDDPPDLDAEAVDPVLAAHRIAGVAEVGCCSELTDARTRILAHLTGVHHHDGGTALADLLWVLVRHRRPAVVVETGVARGISSAFMLDAMERNDRGRLWSIDLPPITSDWGRQTGIAVATEDRHRWTYVRGASRRKLPKVLAECGPVEIFVHDGLHTTENMLFEMRTVWPFLASNGLIVSDDADHNNAVVTFSDEVATVPVLLRDRVKGNVVAVIASGQTARS